MNVTRNKYHHDMNIWRTVAMTTPTAPILRVPSIARVIRDTLEMESLVLTLKNVTRKWTTAMSTPIVPTLKDRFTARVIQDTLEMECFVQILTNVLLGLTTVMLIPTVPIRRALSTALV